MAKTHYIPDSGHPSFVSMTGANIASGEPSLAGRLAAKASTIATSSN